MIIFFTALKRILISPASWILILLFPVIFSAVIYFVNADSPSVAGATLPFGVVDLDDSPLSRALISQLETRFTIVPIEEAAISESLTEALLPSVMVIREGYARDVLAGIAPVLDAYSLTVSDVSMLGNVVAERTTHALMLLGTDDPAALARWEAASAITVQTTGARDNWPGISQLLGFYGFIVLGTAFAVARPLMQDKRQGMPERLGVLPASPRKVLVNSTLAAMTAITIGTVLLLLIMSVVLPEGVPNPVYLFLFISLYNVFAVGFVLALATLLKTTEAVTSILSMGGTVIAMLGGLFWPLEMAPAFMQRVAWFSPGYWFLRGVRNIRDISFDGYILPLLLLTAFTALVLMLGGLKKIKPMED